MIRIEVYGFYKTSHCKEAVGDDWFGVYNDEAISLIRIKVRYSPFALNPFANRKSVHRSFAHQRDSSLTLCSRCSRSEGPPSERHPGSSCFPSLDLSEDLACRRISCFSFILRPYHTAENVISHKPECYRLLRGVTEQQDWEPWLIFMLKAVELTAKKTMKRIDDIRILLDEILEEAKHKLPDRVYSKELIELLFEQPYCKVKFLVDRNLAKRQTAADYLKELESAGILKSKQVGREMLYLNTRLYELLSS